jgi:hypothetical protein
MPGPVSDAYDPEFSTVANADLVREAIEVQRDRITTLLGPKLKNIIDVVNMDPSRKEKSFTLKLTERDLRVIRFALNRALETI